MRLCLIIAIVMSSLLAACFSGDSGPKLHSISAADRDHGRTFSIEGKTYFAGTVNGFSFSGPEYFDSDHSQPCDAGLIQPATQAELDASKLQFKADYVPSGLALALQTGSTCGGRVLNVAKVWRSSAGQILRIAHDSAIPSLLSGYTADQIKTATIKGKASVAVEDDEPEIGHFAPILMRDKDGSFWYISTSGSLREALKVAASVH
jgi:hypothetical protein